MGEFNTALGNEGGGVPLVLYAGTPQEQVWLLSYPDQATKAQYETWMEERAYRTAERSKKYLSTTSYLQSLDHLNNAVDDDRLKWGTQRWLEKVGSDKGLTLLLWLLLRPRHPDVTQEDVAALATQALVEDPPLPSTVKGVPDHPGKLMALILKMALAGKGDTPGDQETAPPATA